MSQSLYRVNLECVRNHHPGMRIGNDRYQPVARIDGFFYARIWGDEGHYTVSQKENIALDLYTFRQEIHNAVHHGADLFFLLGLGLGYRLRAISATLQTYPQVQLVVLEENPSMINLACHCSDLREVFRSQKIAWVINPDLQNAVQQAIQSYSWFGANQSVFFWGYQTHEQAFQPDYMNLAQRITQYIQQSQRDFAQHWRNWLRVQIHTASQRTALILPDTLSSHQIEILRKQYSPHAEITIPTQRYCSNTYLMQKIMKANTNHLLWINLEPGTGMPKEVFDHLPLKNDKIKV